jgi:acyl-coenzyme A thioesterase PaaI-like protein
MADERALQDYFQGTCFGCGAANEHGLQIKSFLRNGIAICDWTPEPYHNAGGGFMHGGVIASVLDCHMAAAGMFRILKDDGLELTETYPSFNCLTANLNVDYLAPTPMGPVRLESWVTKIDGKKVFISGTISGGDTITAKSTGLFIKVPR